MTTSRNIWTRFEDMTWPVANEALDELEWRLRYSNDLDRVDALSAASVISAYRHLITCTERKRSHVVRCIKQQTGITT